MINQKFKRGDRVRLADMFPSYMRHFEGAGREAVVMYSYKDRYGHLNTVTFEDINGNEVKAPDSEPEYCLSFDEYGEISWYPEALLTKLPPSAGRQG